MGQQAMHKPTLVNVLYDYSSVMVELPKILASKIMLWGKDNVQNEVLYTPDGISHGREEEIHITLMYGIYSQTPKQIYSILQHQPPFEVKLGKISLFSNEVFNVVKIEAFSPALTFLNKLLESNIENKKSPFPYRPHVTIAYINRHSKMDLKEMDSFEGINWTVNSLNFSSRNGAKARIRLNNTLKPVRC